VVRTAQIARYNFSTASFVRGQKMQSDLQTWGVEVLK
jgi:hypothetical protein